MITINKITNNLEDSIINIKISKDKKQNIIDKFKLLDKGLQSKKILHNVEIITNKYTYDYYKINSIEYKLHNNLFIHKYDRDIISNFEYSSINHEELYNEYSNIFKSVMIILKEYDNYLILDYVLDNDILDFFLNNLDNFII